MAAQALEIAVQQLADIGSGWGLRDSGHGGFPSRLERLPDVARPSLLPALLSPAVLVRSYEQLRGAFKRLQGTQIETNVLTGGTEELEIFRLIDRVKIVRETRVPKVSAVSSAHIPKYFTPEYGFENIDRTWHAKGQLR